MQADTEVDTKQDVGKVHTDTGSPGGGKTLREGLHFQHRTLFGGRFGVVPHIAHIQEGGSFEAPEQRETVLDVRLQADIARLVRDDEGLVQGGTARTDAAGLPAAQAARAAGIELLLERQRLGVAIRITDTGQQARRQGMLLLLAEGPCPADRALETHILGKRGIPDHPGAVRILFHESLGKG